MAQNLPDIDSWIEGKRNELDPDAWMAQNKPQTAIPNPTGVPFGREPGIGERMWQGAKNFGAGISGMADMLVGPEAQKASQSGLLGYPSHVAHKMLIDPAMEQFGKAKEAFGQGHYSEAAGHGLAGMLPVVGPFAAHTGEAIAQDPVAGGTEALLNIASGYAAPMAVRGVRAGIRTIRAPGAAASAADLITRTSPMPEAAGPGIIGAGGRAAATEEMGVAGANTAERAAYEQSVAKAEADAITARQAKAGELRGARTQFGEEDLLRAADERARAAKVRELSGETQGRVEKHLTERKAAREQALGELLPGGTGEAAGQKIVGTMGERISKKAPLQTTELPRTATGEIDFSKVPDVGAAEKAVWDPLDRQASQIASDLPATTAVANSELGPALESWKRIGATPLSPNTRTVLSKLNPEIETATRDPLQLRGDYVPSAKGGESMSPETLARIRSLDDLQTGHVTADGPKPVSWQALRGARTEIGDLLARARRENILGSSETRTLGRIYEALSEDMRTALPETLREAFDAANQITQYKRQTFGKGPVQKMLRKEGEPGKVYPSQVPGRIAKMPVEEVRATQRAVGPSAEGQEAVRSGMAETIGERAKIDLPTGETKVSPQRALKQLRSGQAQEAMGPEAERIRGEITDIGKRGEADKAFSEHFKKVEKENVAAVEEFNKRRAERTATDTKQARSAQIEAIGQKYEGKTKPASVPKPAERKASGPDYEHAVSVSKMDPEKVIPRLMASKTASVSEAARIRRLIGTDAELLKQTHARILQHALEQATEKAPAGKTGRLEGSKFSEDWGHTRKILEAMDADPQWLESVQGVAEKLGRQMTRKTAKQLAHILVWGTAGAAGYHYVGRHVAARLADLVP